MNKATTTDSYIVRYAHQGILTDWADINATTEIGAKREASKGLAYQVDAVLYNKTTMTTYTRQHGKYLANDTMGVGHFSWVKTLDNYVDTLA